MNVQKRKRTAPKARTCREPRSTVPAVVSKPWRIGPKKKKMIVAVAIAKSPWKFEKSQCFTREFQ
jgi:hypothetical protein